MQTETYTPPQSKAGSHNTRTQNAELVISRDLFQHTYLNLGPDEQQGPSRDPDAAFRETRVLLALNLPTGYTIELSRGMTWECYGPEGEHVEVSVRQITRYLKGWFRAGGARWVVYVVTGRLPYLETIVSAVALKRT